MGNPFLLQGCLRLDLKDIPKPLEIGKKYKFYKEGHRLYMIKVPMDIWTSDWKALGRCVVLEYTVGKGKTEGTFVVVQIFDKKQSDEVTKTYVADLEVEKILKNLE
ncbi:MAG TPA: hypothetical protein VJB94_01680 [Candidatus Nanoarchaeia archaeon]|nr:hypothetical protein [Candidatus Nanoarchaeia archaeon]